MRKPEIRKDAAFGDYCLYGCPKSQVVRGPGFCQDDGCRFFGGYGLSETPVETWRTFAGKVGIIHQPICNHPELSDSSPDDEKNCLNCKNKYRIYNTPPCINCARIHAGVGEDYWEPKEDSIPEKPDDCVDTDGWIEWNGGECPVDGNTVVDVIFRSGKSCKDVAMQFCWASSGSPCDIIKYRIHKDEPEDCEVVSSKMETTTLEPHGERCDKMPKEYSYILSKGELIRFERPSVVSTVVECSYVIVAKQTYCGWCGKELK